MGCAMAGGCALSISFNCKQWVAVRFFIVISEPPHLTPAHPSSPQQASLYSLPLSSALSSHQLSAQFHPAQLFSALVQCLALIPCPALIQCSAIIPVQPLSLLSPYPVLSPHPTLSPYPVRSPHPMLRHHPCSALIPYSALFPCSS